MSTPPTQPPLQASSSANCTLGKLPISMLSSTRITFSMPSAARYRSFIRAEPSPPEEAQPRPIMPVSLVTWGVLFGLLALRSLKYTSLMATT